MTTILTGVFVAFFSAIANIDVIIELTNIGTLFAFVLVCIGILILRHREPTRPRKFRVPFVPVTPLLGIGMCVFLMAGLPLATWIRFVVWLAGGARDLLRLQRASQPAGPERLRTPCWS